MAIDWKYRVIVDQQVVWQSVRIYHLDWGGHHIEEMCYGYNTDGTPRIVWEEYIGNYTTGTLPTGVASLTCTRTSKDPAVSAGVITDNAYLYNKDVLTYTATASSYWNVSIKYPTVTLQSVGPDSQLVREHTVNGVTKSGVSATGQMFTLKASNFGYNRSDTFNMTYYDSTGTQQTYTETYYPTQTTAPVITSLGVGCWRGGKVTWSCTPGSSYWGGYSGTVAIGVQSEDSTKTVTAMYRKTRQIRFYKVTGIASYTVTYTNSSGTRTSVTLTPTSTYSTIYAFIGATVTWSATATSGYTVSPSSGTIAISTSTTAVSVQPTATIAATWKEYPDEYEGGYVTWAASSYSSSTYKTTTQGIVDDTNITSYQKSRITGKMLSSRYGGSVSFSAVELSETAYTKVAEMLVSQEVMGFVVTDTITLYVKGNDTLDAYLTYGGSIAAPTTLTLTKLEVYGS